MPTIHNWEDWDEVEDQTKTDLVREKRNKKSKKEKVKNENVQQVRENTINNNR